VAYRQREVFEAAVLFARAEGICPAPESAHAIKAAIDVALRCRESGEEKCVVFNLSGHGHFDLGAYDKYLDGEMDDFELAEEEIVEGLAALPNVG
jgi:tryptophan synthase beta chain